MIKNNQKSYHQQNNNKLKKIHLNNSEKKNVNILYIIIVFCFPVLLYLQTINYGFTNLDDNRIISDNITFLSDFGNVRQVFLSDAFISKHLSFYRPVQTLSYMIDIQLYGGGGGGGGRGKIWMYHLSNILLLGSIACLLFLLLRKFLIPPKLALTGTLFFCAHPLFVSFTAWVPARGDMLMTLFSLLSFLFLMQLLQNGGKLYIFLHWVSFTIALFCKETTAFLPFIFILYYFTFFFKKNIDKKYIFIILLYASTGILWLWLRSIAIGGISNPENEVGLVPFISNLQTIPESLTKFLIPFDFNPIPVFSIFKTIVGIGIIIIIIIIIILKNTKVAKKEKIFYFSWFLILMIPAMFYKLSYEDYSDHRFFFPSIGILIFILILFPKKHFVNGVIKRPWLIIVILVIQSYLTFIKSKQYSNPFSFYDSAISHNPNSISYNNRGTSYISLGKYDEAIADYNKAIELNPKYIEAYYNRGHVYYDLKLFNKALEDCNKVIELSPKDVEAYNNRGILYYKMNRINEAIPDFKKAISLNNKYLEAYKNLGGAFLNLKNYYEAIDYYSKAILLSETDAQLLLYRGLSYINIDRNDLACKDWLKAKELGRPDAEDYIVKYCK